MRRRVIQVVAVWVAVAGRGGPGVGVGNLEVKQRDEAYPVAHRYVRWLDGLFSAMS